MYVCMYVRVHVVSYAYVYVSMLIFIRVCVHFSLSLSLSLSVSVFFTKKHLISRNTHSCVYIDKSIQKYGSSTWWAFQSMLPASDS